MQGHAMLAPEPGARARSTPCAPGSAAPARGPALAALPALLQPRPPASGWPPRERKAGRQPREARAACAGLELGAGEGRG